MSLGGGRSGGGGTTTSTTSPDPTQQELNRLLSGQISGLVDVTGGTRFFGQRQPLLTTLSPEEETARGDITRFLREGPGITLEDLVGAPRRLGRPRVRPDDELGIGAPEGAFDVPRPERERFGGPSTLINPAEQLGFSSLISAADPTRRLGAAREFFEDIVGPALLGQTAAAGFGRRSGAATEALARGGAELTLPILQDVARAQGQLGATGLAFGPQLESRALDRLFAGADVAGLPRSMEAQDFLRKQGLLLSLISGAPFVGGQTSTTKQRSQQRDVNFLTDLLVPLGAAGLIGFCWVAEALYGLYAVQTALARQALREWGGPWAVLGRIAYRVAGRPVAQLARRSARVRGWLRPLFDRAVRVGAESHG